MWVDIFSEEDEEVVRLTKNLIYQSKIKLIHVPIIFIK